MKFNSLDIIKKHIDEHSFTLEKLSLLHNEIEVVAESIVKCIECGGKILICGNGGSAADAQHFAAEIVGRYLRERPGLPALSLTSDSSILTAVSNDYGFDNLFSRQIEALAKENDILIVISTSGNSKNLINAIKMAKRKKISSIGFLGNNGGKAKELVNQSIVVPSNKTAHIQEMHITIIHIICMIIDKSVQYK